VTDIEYAKGLEGVIAAESEICQIDGANGKLYYRGYSIEDLAQHSSFEDWRTFRSECVRAVIWRR